MKDWMEFSRMELSGKERALRMLNFEEVDRIPIIGGWAAHGDFLTKASGVKTKYNFAMSTWENPMRVALKAYKNVGADLIPQFILPKRLETTTGDDLGRSTEFSLGGARAIDPLRYKTPEDVVEYVHNLPKPEDLRSAFESDDAYRRYVADMKEAQEECGDDTLWISGYGQCGFMWYGVFGYQPYLLACLRYRNEMKKLFEYSGEHGRIYNEVIVKAVKEEGLPPFVYGGQDICYDHGPMLSPKLLDEIYFPYLKRAIEPLRNAGIKTIWHCDGDMMPIIGRLIDVGIDGFQGFQEEYGVDLDKIVNMKTKSGDKPIIFGSVSVTSTLPFGTVEDVKRSVERCINIAAPGAGFVLAPTSTVGPDIPVENIFAMYEHGKNYGRKFVSKS
ncbi:MAG: uroporphyrinogen decarboxylase family protein [Candidatus Bathyarchaeia archaeon]